jgi:hypothetical protein
MRAASSHALMGLSSEQACAIAGRPMAADHSGLMKRLPVSA